MSDAPAAVRAGDPRCAADRTSPNTDGRPAPSILASVMESTLIALKPPPGRAALPAVLEPIVAAAMRGQQELLLAETERAAVRLFPGVTARALAYVGGRWHDWSQLDAAGAPPGPAVPAGLHQLDAPHRRGTDIYLPIVPGAVCLLIGDPSGAVDTSEALEVFRHCVGLALQTCERQRVAAQNLDEVHALQRVATRILKSHDLNEILLLITQEAKRLLSADICGVMLRDGDQIAMRRCVGNHSPETSSLRMGPGQGLAGRVLETKEPSSVEDYLESDLISRDFFHLAEAETVRSALAAPLLSRDDVIGVLEVWRRRPSTFSALDSLRLVALANLTSIAIENADLYAAQRATVDELARAHAALSERYDVVRDLSNLTQSLMQQLLQGGGLPAIVESAKGFLESEVAIFDLDGGSRAWGGADGQSASEQAVCAALPRRGAKPIDTTDVSRLDLGADGVWAARPLMIEGLHVGWVAARIGPRGADVTELGIAQVAVVASVHLLEQRAASRARSETIDSIVWDLLQQDEAVRAAALDRAGEVKIDLEGPLRLFVAEFGPSSPGGVDVSTLAVRQRIVRAIAEARRVRAVAMRGLTLAILCSDEPLDDAERSAQKLARSVGREVAERLVFVGGSSRCPLARNLPTAYREAVIALDVARQLGRTGAVVYDRAGVVGMLLGLRHEAGMRRFLELNLGALLHEDARNRDQLLQTLRVYFDVNCSHEAAAQRLNVHRKTISYRLAKIGELTGLDLSTHDDRLVADLSLYVYHMLSGQGEPPAP